MKCEEVYGHGDLQFDRQNFEGVRLSRLSRRVCELEAANEAPIVPPQPVAVTAGSEEAAAVAETAGPSGG